MANKVKKRKKPRIYEIDETNDRKFHGIFSYRHLRILGWTFMALAQLGLILSLFAKQTGNGALSTSSSVLNFFAGLMAPLFLLAAFAQVLTVKDGYKKLITVYVGGSLGIFALFLIVFYHFVVGTLNVFTNDAAVSTQTAVAALSALAGYSGGFFAFNVFIDLALCALLTFFLNYRPTKFFQGKLLYLFRGFAALPILYEIASIVLKILASNGIITLTPFLFPLLTAKPPVAFLIFVALAVFMKLRERSFLKHGKTLEDYKRFLDTNANKTHFSRFLIVAIIVACIIDFFAILFASVGIASSIQGTEADQALTIGILTANSWGLGNCLPMLLTIPIVAFFDYRKTYTNKMIDTVIPLAGIALIAIIYIEGLFQFGKFMIPRILEKLPNFGEAEEEESLIVAALRAFQE